jgi:hypothetical protein
VRRPRTDAPPRGVVLTLRDGREWAPVPPLGGWTPVTALAAAFDFSDGDRRATAEAHRALLRAVPGLHRADAVDRLRGEDHFRRLFP